MKIGYTNKSFRDTSLETIEMADAIMDEYAADGYDLTLRQLYYQFVARDLIENTERSYKRLGKLISEARLAGLLPWNVMVDRTRELRDVSHWDGPGSIIRACAQQFRLDTRCDQNNYIEVWVEKEALAGIVLAACDDLDLSCIICRGYVSQSAMWQAAQRFGEHREQRRFIIYLGDHDPSGIDMTRDIDERLNEVFGETIEVVRIALTMPQVERYDCPPNPAKVTDSRYAGYRRMYGDESWELDALEPRVLTSLIKTAVAKRTHTVRLRKQQEAQKRHRATLQKLAETL